MVANLRKFAPKGEIGEDDVRNVTVAGLMHDVGHAVSSHQFERHVLKKLAYALLGNVRPECTWSHEDASGMLLEHIVDKYYIDISKEDVKKIIAMIKGDKPKTDDSAQYLYEIVANKDNSVDVDKFDYLSRDAYNMGMKTAHFDYDRLIASSRIIDNAVCFHAKNDYNVYSVFQSRYQLFKNIYKEKVSMAINFMIGDALLEAGTKFKYLEYIHEPEEYVKLTDCIVETIEWSKSEVKVG